MSPCTSPFRVRVPVPADPSVVRVPLPGPMGPAGRDGTDGSAITLVAAVALSGHRVVRSDASGRAVYASALEPGDAAAALGVTRGAVDAGASVQVDAVGDVEEPSWAWLPGQPVWLGPGGTLVQPAPASGDLRSVGVAITPTRLALALGTPLIRT